MRRSLIGLFILVFIISDAFSQCYSPLREEGLKALSREHFKEAVNKFFAAKNCPDKPQIDDLDDLIKKTQIQWENKTYNALFELKNTISKYLSSEGEKAMKLDDYRSALRLLQHAFAYNSDNKLAANLLLDSLPNYVSITANDIYQDEYGEDTPEFIFSSNFKYFVWLSNYSYYESLGRLNILNLEILKRIPIDQFYKGYSEINGAISFSPSFKKLVYWSKNKRKFSLNLIDLENDTIVDLGLITDKPYSQDLNKFGYSTDESIVTFRQNFTKKPSVIHLWDLENNFRRQFSNTNKFEIFKDSSQLDIIPVNQDQNLNIHDLKPRSSCTYLFIDGDTEQPSTANVQVHSKDSISILDSAHNEIISYPDAVEYKASKSGKFIAVVRKKGTSNDHIFELIDAETVDIKKINVQNYYPNSIFISKNGGKVGYFSEVEEKREIGVLNIYDIIDGELVAFPNTFVLTLFYKDSLFNKLESKVQFFTNVDNNDRRAVLNIWDFNKKSLETFSNYKFPVGIHDPDFMIEGELMKYICTKIASGSIKPDGDQILSDSTILLREYFEFFPSKQKIISIVSSLKVGKEVFNGGSTSKYFNSSHYKISFSSLVPGLRKNLPTTVLYNESNNKVAIYNSKTNVIHIFDLQNKNEIRRIKHRNPIENFEFLEDGKYLISISRGAREDARTAKISFLDFKGNILDYYDKLFSKFSKEEKEQYGLRE